MRSLVRIKNSVPRLFTPAIRQRIVALLLLLCFVTGTVTPAASAYAATRPQNPTPTDHKNVVDKTTKMKTDYAGALPEKQSENKPAADVDTGPANLLKLPQGESVQTKTTNVKAKAEELLDKRTPTASFRRNSDGTITKTQYFTPKFFKKDGKWVDIDTALVEDKNAGDASNFVGQAWGIIRSIADDQTTFTVKDNDWQARFAPSDFDKGMVRIKVGDSQVGFSPVGANAVKPVVTNDADGQQLVRYKNLWKGVDVEYIVKSGELKENILISSPTANSDFSFKIIGASLKKSPQNTGINGLLYDIDGALGNDFSIAPLSISLNKYGFEANNALSHKFENGTLSISVDKTYLQNLPKDAFPVTVDPTTVRNSAFGTRAGGNYASFKSDGYVCNSTICNPYAGSVQDSGGVWRYWQGAIFSDYSFVNGKQLNSATLHLVQRLGLSVSGTTAVKNFQARHATCLALNCLGAASGVVAIGTVGDIDVTSIYSQRIAANDWGAWLMITGEQTSALTYKNWDPGTNLSNPDGSYVSFTYTDVLTTPSLITPQDGDVFVDPQVSLRSNAYTNPASGAALQYLFCVSTAPGCNGAVIVSNPQPSTQWTVPDGILEDGTTYYAQVQTYDPAVPVYSSWSSSRSFRVDDRTGKDSTQVYDTLGPVAVDMATGNMSTSASSHTSSALGGALGVNLDYNSPMRSRSGLVGEYWNNNTFSGTPSLTKVDQNVDFDWGTSAPAGGIGTDNFSTRWTGYFVAPVTGSYQFGGNNDDSLVVKINGQSVYVNGGCYSGVCYDTPVSLTAGQVASIVVEHAEATGPAYAHLYVKGAVTEQVVPKEWLQTGVRDVAAQNGLTGRYYKDSGSHDFNAATMFMQRNDSLVSFDWGSGGPVASGPTDNFMARWTGYVTVPTTGTYDFGTVGDDGTRVSVGSSTNIINNWQNNPSTPVWSSSVSLTANQPTPITVDYFEGGGGASMYLKIRSTSLSIAEQVIPNTWLSPKAQVLPNGWELGMGTGGVSYDRMRTTQNSAILTDSSGSTHEYVWNTAAQSYKPPVNEDGVLVRNADGTHTLQDSDGRTYVFNVDGTLASATNPLNDTQPAALQYTYSGTPARLTQVTDGVTSSRWAKLYYSGDSNCATAPTTFDTQAPSGMLCAVTTNDGRITSFFYKNKRLARIAKPGSELTDYQYDTLGRIVSFRDPLANDAIAAGQRADNDTTNTTIAYDDLGRVISVTQPAATTGATRIQHTIEYLPGNGTYFGATQQHVVGMTEPNGFARRVEYDKLFRSLKDTNIANLSSTTEWHVSKDLVLSTTDATGMKATTIYDDEDRAVTKYGPAPAAWYGTDRKPLTAYTSQVPRGDVAYDEGMQGPRVSYYQYSTTTATLTGAPKLHSTNLVGAPSGQVSRNFGSTSPISGITDNWGLRATGRLRLPTTGQYRIRVASDNGIRLYVDDTLLVDDWNDGSDRSHPEQTIDNVAGTVHRFHIQYYHRTGNANLAIYLTPPGGSETQAIAQYISPDYGLTTSAKTYDSTIGDMTATVNYGANPELGLAQGTTIDPTGLNLTASSTYETQGATGSLLRQTSKTLPGGNTTNYTYYTATDTKDNPCTTGTTEAFKQAGFIKSKTEPDPDGAGSQTGRVVETIYDDAGRVVATRYNSESWSCNTIDSRSRITQVTAPAFNGAAARTSTHNYAVGGNPLVVSVGDAMGDVVNTIDLLGRTVSYTDAYGDTTTSVYDSIGRLQSRTSQLGAESFVYDGYNRLVDQKLDNTVYSHIVYDQYSRVDYVTYPTAGPLKLTPSRDSLGRLSGQTYTKGGNLVENPSLEQASSSNLNSPTAWLSSAWGTNTTSFSYLTDGHTGTRSAKVEMTSYTSGDAKWYFKPVPVTGSTNYTFKDYYRSSIASQVVLQYTNQDGSNSYQWLADLSANSNWTASNLSFTTPSTAVEVTAFHLIAGVGWLTVDDAELYQTSLATPTVIAADAVTRSQSGRIVSGTELGQSKTYTYDKAGRLTAATMGSNSYAYGFGAASGCSGAYNTNAGKNSNRMSQTINGTNTTYCYDSADRLISSSNSLYNSPTYDAHGNMTAIGTGSTPLYLSYDSSDRNVGFEQYTSSGNGQSTYYDRDVSGRIIGRYTSTIAGWNWTSTGNYFYGFTGTGDGPSYIRDSSWTITEKYLRLPGALLTIRPNATPAANKKVYSLVNMHGDVTATLNATGALISTFTYDPFGNAATTPNNTATGSTYGWAGINQKLNETTFALTPTQMGARVYFSVLGRFTQVDPIDGGTPNAYVYPGDPINFNDFTGLLTTVNSSSTVRLTVGYNYGMQPSPAVPAPVAPQRVQVTAPATKVQATAPAKAVQGPGAVSGSVGVAKANTQQTSVPVSALTGIFISKVTWKDTTLQVYPTVVGRYAPWPARGLAWSEVVALVPEASTSGMMDQFYCHWDFVRIRAPHKESWNLDSSRPDASYWGTVMNQCNP